MNKNSAAQKGNKNKQRAINLIIAIFIFLSVAATIFIGKGFLVPQPAVEVGQIAQQDIYAPFEFSFIDIDGKEISVKKDEIIVARGQKINKTQHLANNELKINQKQPKNLYYILGILLLMIIFCVIIVTYQTIRKLKVLTEVKNIVLLCLVALLLVLAAKGIILSGWSVYLIPIASVSMLVAILIDPSVSLMFTVILSVFIGVLTGVRLDVMVAMLAGGIVSIYSVINVRRRRDFTKAGILIGLTNIISIVAMGMINFISINYIIKQGAWGLANGILSGFIITALLPVFEGLFGITTNISLLELSDLNQPVLKELVLKAPGTYHHSLVVGNLAESAAEAVGANTLLARVGGYFHDIGKLRMAPYFTENQAHSEDKHENLSPTISSLIIINHVKEGSDLAKKYRLGSAINDIIEQHHGDAASAHEDGHQEKHDDKSLGFDGGQIFPFYKSQYLTHRWPPRLPVPQSG